MIWRPANFWPDLNTQGSCPDTLGKQGIHIDFPLSGAEYHSSTFVAKMVKGRVLGDARLVLTQNNIALGNLQFIYGAECPEQHDLIRKRRFCYPKRLQGSSLLLTASNGDNYYHWLFDSLPRLKLLQSSRFSKETIDHVLLNRKSGQFQLDSLRMLDIDLSKVRKCQKRELLICDQLLVPSMPGPQGKPERWMCDFLRHNFTSNKPPSPVKRKIYISRAKAQGRKLVNESELLPLLQRRGFETVFTENLSFPEQVQLFTESSHIIAPHGAGLSNIVFAQPGARVMELGTPLHHNDVFRLIAHGSDIDYFHLFLDPAPDANDKKSLTNMHISADRFEIALKSFI